MPASDQNLELSVMPQRLHAMALACAFILSHAAWEAGEIRRIVLIGGVKSETAAQHDYPNGVRLLKAFLDSSPDVQALEGLVVDAWPDGWPSDPAAFDGIATIVWYFDGVEKHPLLDAAHRARIGTLMKRGVGLVALHQATTVPAGDPDIGVDRWLGGARHGMFDRTTEMVEFVPAAHPVSRGVWPFTYQNEFYPTIRFAVEGKVTPVLTGKLHVQFREGKFLVIDQATPSTVAWAFEREGGGRAFGFSGAHDLVALDEPALRRLLLNSILWTAYIEVPEGGVRSGLADAACAAADAAGGRKSPRQS